MKIRKCRVTLCCFVLGLLVMIMACISSKERIETFHRQALVWDCHNDLSYRVLYEKLDIGQRLPAGHVDIPRLKEGGVDVQTVALFIQNFLYPDQCARQARQLQAAMLKMIEQNSDQVELARTGSDIERIVAAGKIAIPLAIEGGHAIENSLENLREFHRQGVSSMTLTHNVTHDWADSGADEPRWGGLNELGREVVPESNLESSIQLLPEDQVRLSNDPKKTEIFRDAGLGLFIHWGPNSQVGSEISWPLNNASEEYIEKYYALAETFNPIKFDAAEWARLAKLAGMEYVVFTTKHHDGFCMFDTKYSQFKITNTPYAKDIVAQVAEAFRKEGLLVGFYYSPGDFRYHYETGVPQQGLMTPAFESEVSFGPEQKSFLAYEQGHVEELLTRYGDIFMLWFDGKCEPLKKHAWRIRQDVFIGRGEIPTPEQRIPGKAADHAWESCMTTSWQWSYQPHPDLRTSKEVILNLVKIRARGGNMLLNVGPKPDGRISDPDEAILRDLGLWMMMYGEAVREVRPWTVTNESDVWLTQKKNGEYSTLYAVTDFSYDEEGTSRQPFSGRRFTLKSVKATEQTEVSILGQSGTCQWHQDEKGLHITAFNQHTVQIIAYPGNNPEFKQRAWNWGPDWPVAIKITKVKPIMR